MMSGGALFEDLPEMRAPHAADAGAGAPRLRQPQRDQIELRVCDLDSLLPAEHPARVIWAYVERLDLTRLHAAIKAREGVAGHPPIDPRLMLALWLYATSQGIGSGRVLERLCESDTAYRWLCGGVSVNYHTLNDFRVAHPALLDELLAANVAALAQAGVIDLETLAQDGIRVRAAAGAGSYRRRQTAEAHLQAARALVARLNGERGDDPDASNRRAKAARERAARERDVQAGRVRVGAGVSADRRQQRGSDAIAHVHGCVQIWERISALPATAEPAAAPRYHAIVRASPSRRPVFARKPNSRSAREVSSQRRGWPSGLDVSQTISPEKPTSSAISSVSSAIEIS